MGVICSLDEGRESTTNDGASPPPHDSSGWVEAPLGVGQPHPVVSRPKIARAMIHFWTSFAPSYISPIFESR